MRRMMINTGQFKNARRVLFGLALALLLGVAGLASGPTAVRAAAFVEEKDNGDGTYDIVVQGTAVADDLRLAIDIDGTVIVTESNSPDVDTNRQPS